MIVIVDNYDSFTYNLVQYFGEIDPDIPPYVDHDAYVKDGGYRLLNDLRAGRVSKEDILKALDDSSLRGLGGAGFPTGRKWRAVLGEPGPRLMAVCPTFQEMEEAVKGKKKA